MIRKVFVANLSWSVSTEEFISEFSKCGTITRSNLVLDAKTGQSKGYGFVEYTTQAEAGVAVQALNGYSLKGRPIKVELAKN